VIGRACLSVSKTVYLFAETQLAIGGEMTSESLGRLKNNQGDCLSRRAEKGISYRFLTTGRV